MIFKVKLRYFAYVKRILSIFYDTLICQHAAMNTIMILLISMTIKKSLKASGFILSLFAFVMLYAGQARAADCGNDPVYERDMTGRATVGSRVRDWACMEDSKILTVIPAGTQVHIIGETDGWYKVKVGDKTGWVGAQLLSITSDDQSSGKVESDSSAKPAATNAAVKLIGIDEDNYRSLKEGNRDLRNRLKNMIVLRVHFHGEAYLVNEDGTLKSLKADEVKALKEKKAEVKEKAQEQKKEQTGAVLKLRKLIGIDEANFAKLEAGDATLRARLMDMLVLRVHKHGEAYWVNPDGGLKFLGPGEVGYYLTQNLKPDQSKTGSSDDNGSDDSKVEDSKDDQISTSGSITLSGQLTDPGKVKLTWTTTDLDAPKGFKVVISESANPVYPGNTYHYLDSSSAREDVWTKLTGGKTYHFRVCQYLGGKCGVYSNDLPILVETNGMGSDSVMPGSIDLTVTAVSGGKANISWSLTDMTSPKGFKVVVDEDPNPVYPGNDYHYLDNPDTRADTWTGLESGKTYHFRVCEYLGGYCGTYSNDASVTAL